RQRGVIADQEASQGSDGRGFVPHRLFQRHQRGPTCRGRPREGVANVVEQRAALATHDVLQHHLAVRIDHRLSPFWLPCPCPCLCPSCPCPPAAPWPWAALLRGDRPRRWAVLPVAPPAPRPLPAACGSARRSWRSRRRSGPT